MGCAARPVAGLSGPAASALIHPPSSPDPAAGSAAALASRLVVKGRAPTTGYDRDAFGPSWSDDVGRVVPVSGGRNGCDQRNDVLRRDLTVLVVKPRTNGCVAASGTLVDPYTGTRIAFVRGPRSADVQIDHVVALADAWQKGAQQWDPLLRRDFAGDPLNLLAVKGSANQSKGAGDAATWLPPRKAFRCDYAARIVAVKVKYGVWVTAAEKSALLWILAGCPGQSLPAATTVAVPAIQR
ncbi:MAG: HNH endonuclease family protein [Nakamurella sp.]